MNVAPASVPSVEAVDLDLPGSLYAQHRDEIAVLALARPEKRNALDRATVRGIEAFFTALPSTTKAVVLANEGYHFCSGLDLSEATELGLAQSIALSRSWHSAFERIEFAKVPVIAVLK